MSITCQNVLLRITSNRTSLELKHFSRYVYLWLSFTSNRTSLELKRYVGYAFFYSYLVLLIAPVWN